MVLLLLFVLPLLVLTGCAASLARGLANLLVCFLVLLLLFLLVLAGCATSLACRSVALLVL